jgi:hypothetical protein
MWLTPSRLIKALANYRLRWMATRPDLLVLVSLVCTVQSHHYSRRSDAICEHMLDELEASAHACFLP